MSITQETEEMQLSDAQRARAERNRQRAHALRSSRLAQRPATVGKCLLDSGGGFLLEDEEEEESGQLVQPPAPLVHHSEQPHCLDCLKPFPQSYLFDSFGYSVCDQCRDEEKHSLITRTEAKNEFLLKDCDLDLRPPALRCVRRRNPHRARASDMRLYLRLQVQQRALDVWGSPHALEEEREARARRRQRAADTAARRRLRALRMDVRSSLFARSGDAHEHELGEERRVSGPDDDLYERSCACGYVQRYEKI